MTTSVCAQFFLRRKDKKKERLPVYRVLPRSFNQSAFHFEARCEISPKLTFVYGAHEKVYPRGHVYFHGRQYLFL